MRSGAVGWRLNCTLDLDVNVSRSSALTASGLAVIKGVVERMLGLGVDLDPFDDLAELQISLRRKRSRRGRRAAR